MKRFLSSESAEATRARACARPAVSRWTSSVPSPWTTCAPRSAAAAIESGFTSMTTYSLPACSNSAATLRPTRPNPQMIVWSRSWPMALLLRPCSEVLPDDPARDQLDDRARKVEEDCHAREEEDDGEDLRRRSLGPRVEPRQRRRDDGAVERRRPALVGEQDEAHRADGEHDDERDQRDDEAPEAEPLHGVIVCGARSARSARRRGRATR